ncbi:avidin/streptavidin family protein [Litorimonas sp. RW-G-Af-16]|uniref:avidin/streptavidin family protein n=1 Tax=Litorimonas sp. RW-G-Af-16 TaxID=3241168 RepID=UPI00390C425F
MKHLLTASMICLAACTASSSPATEAPQDLFSGQWMNDRGSMVTLQNDFGVLTGYYQTALGEPDKSKQFPLTGFAEDDQLGFIVNFKGYNSLTSWTGQLTEDKDGPYIHTLWHLTRNVMNGDEDEDLWQSITTGASDFRPVDQE